MYREEHLYCDEFVTSESFSNTLVMQRIVL